MIRCTRPLKGAPMMSTTTPAVSAADGLVPDTFPFYRFSGTHREIGLQYGEACRALIQRHRDLALARLDAKAGVSRAGALARALEYRPWVQRYAGFFDDEIQGVARAAGLTLAEAY